MLGIARDAVRLGALLRPSSPYRRPAGPPRGSSARAPCVVASEAPLFATSAAYGRALALDERTVYWADEGGLSAAPK